MDSITSMEALSKVLSLSESEKAWKPSGIGVPLKVSPYYLSLINADDPDDPIRRQVVPTCSENTANGLESPDPLKEVDHSHGERLIHRYGNRVAFLTTDLCETYCRHCFRRRFTGNMMGPASAKDIADASEYLRQHREVREMLLTGGDVLTLDDSRLEHMIASFREASPSLVMRICTRTVVTKPDRITDNLIAMLKRHNTAPFYLLTQFNHPRELTQTSIQAVAKFVDNGIPAMNQTVLLRGVNDNADTLEELCNKLLFNRIKPYYLFQGDLVLGTSSFRVPLERGMEIEHELRRRLSGLAMPNYTLDLPEGGGKIPLCGSYVIGHEKGSWTFRTPNGSERTYTDPVSLDN